MSKALFGIVHQKKTKILLQLLLLLLLLLLPLGNHRKSKNVE